MPSRVEGLGLRYTSFVEVMAPIASRRVMNEIIMPNLADSYYGWGEWGGARGLAIGCVVQSTSAQ